MFVRFTTPEGRAILIRAARVQAVAAAEDGTSHIMLTAGVQAVVVESLDEVEQALQPTDD